MFVLIRDDHPSVSHSLVQRPNSELVSKQGTRTLTVLLAFKVHFEFTLLNLDIALD